MGLRDQPIKKDDIFYYPLRSFCLYVLGAHAKKQLRKATNILRFKENREIFEGQMYKQRSVTLFTEEALIYILENFMQEKITPRIENKIKDFIEISQERLVYTEEEKEYFIDKKWNECIAIWDSLTNQLLNSQ